MKINLYAFAVFCLFILTAIGPAAGLTGDKGSVTIVQPREEIFSIGDTIAFGGKNTASETTYLFITGPGLDTKGSQIQSTHPHDSPVIDGNASTFQAISGFAGNKWYWEWNTHNVLLDAGTYTVYIASAPHDLPHIDSTRYTKFSFMMKKPANAPATTVTSTGSNAAATTSRTESGITSPGDNLTSPSVAIHGDKLTISGTAKGNPRPGVGIWIMGTPGNGTAGYANQFVVQPDSTGFYSLDLDDVTARLGDGNYHVVVQHPMKNNALDIYLAGTAPGDAKYGWVWNRMLSQNNDGNGTKIFRALGPGSLQGNDAYEALVFAFNDPVVDDVIAVSPSLTIKTTGSGDTVPAQQTRVLATPSPLTGGQTKKTAGSGNLLDRVWDFLSGIF